MSRLPVVILLGATLFGSAALAETWVRVEKDGSKTYSDRPLPGGKPVDLQPAQTYSAPPAPDAQGGTPEEQALRDAANFRYAGCAMSPRTDETFHNPESVTVSLSLQPNLRVGDSVVFSMDGAPIPAEGGALSVTLPQPNRGSHTVTARVTDRFGKVLCDASTTFHVQRPSIFSPARRPPPRGR